MAPDLVALFQNKPPISAGRIWATPTKAIRPIDARAVVPPVKI